MNRIARILYLAKSLVADFQDVSALKRYLKDKPFHIYDFKHEFEQYNDFEELLEKADVDLDEWNQASNDEDFDKIEELSEKATSAMSEKEKEDFTTYLLENYPEDAPSWGHLDFESYVLPSNTWLIHFSNSAYEIKQSGFTYGVDQMDKLGLTTYFSDAYKKYGGYNFAFDADSKDASNAARSKKYGKDAVIFRAPGVKAYHHGDNENQIIFYGKDVNPKNIILLENQDGDWAVIGGKRGELYKSQSFGDVVSWVQKNYRQYEKPMTASDNNLEAKIKPLLPKLAEKAQEEYDAWDEEDKDTYAGGGICHLIADELCDVLNKHNIDCSTMTHAFKQHVITIAFDIPSKTIFSIDLPEYVYETGGGFSWKKIPDVEITPNDFVIEELEWEHFFDENDELMDVY